MKRFTCVFAVVLLYSMLLGTGISSGAPGNVLYETTFSEDDFTWDDWQTEWDWLMDDRTPLGTFWIVEDGCLTTDPDQVENWTQVVVLTDGWEWTDYRIDIEIELVAARATWIFRAETPGDFELYEFHDDGGMLELCVWPRMGGSGQHKYCLHTGIEYEPGKVYSVTVEVEDFEVRHYVDGDLIDEDDGVWYEYGTVGFQLCCIAEVPNRIYRVHSLKVTEL